jgi:heat shock protein HslJ
MDLRTKATAAAVVLAAVAALTAAAPAEATAALPQPRVPTAAELAGHTYTAGTWYDGGAVRPLAERRSVRISFAEGGKGLSANFGCNQISGSFTVEGGRLRTAGLAMTRMYCTSTAEQERELVALVESQPLIRLRGNLLVLRAAGARLVLRDRQQAPTAGAAAVSGGVRTKGDGPSDYRAIRLRNQSLIVGQAASQ